MKYELAIAHIVNKGDFYVVTNAIYKVGLYLPELYDRR